MDISSLITALLAIITGQSGVLGLLVIIIFFIGWLFIEERKTANRLQNHVNEIIDRYYKNQIDATSAMDKISSALVEIRNELHWKNK